MKKITIEVPDSLYDELNHMRSSSYETIESIAATILYEGLYSDELDALWDRVDAYEAKLYDDEALLAAVKEITELIITCNYSTTMRPEKARTLLEEVVNLLATLESDHTARAKILNFAKDLDAAYHEQSVTIDDIDVVNNDCTCRHHQEAEHSCRHK